MYADSSVEIFFLQTARRRRGVPHIAQPHQLVIGAVQALDTLLPNFRAEVRTESSKL